MAALTTEQVQSLMNQRFEAAHVVGYNLANPKVWFEHHALNPKRTGQSHE